jgi:hypothetical protein
MQAPLDQGKQPFLELMTSGPGSTSPFATTFVCKGLVGVAMAQSPSPCPTPSTHKPTRQRPQVRLTDELWRPACLLAYHQHEPSPLIPLPSRTRRPGPSIARVPRLGTFPSDEDSGLALWAALLPKPLYGRSRLLEQIGGHLSDRGHDSGLSLQLCSWSL